MLKNHIVILKLKGGMKSSSIKALIVLILGSLSIYIPSCQVVPVNQEIQLYLIERINHESSRYLITRQIEDSLIAQLQRYDYVLLTEVENYEHTYSAQPDQGLAYHELQQKIRETQNKLDQTRQLRTEQIRLIHTLYEQFDISTDSRESTFTDSEVERLKKLVYSKEAEEKLLENKLVDIQKRHEAVEKNLIDRISTLQTLLYILIAAIVGIAILPFLKQLTAFIKNKQAQNSPPTPFNPSDTPTSEASKDNQKTT